MAEERVNGERQPTLIELDRCRLWPEAIEAATAEQ
jgi:hypothetical protein